jgi:predicted DNA-binding transcriptional regulator YafY
MLLEARKPVTLDEIRYSVHGYDQVDSSSFKRMFERDKSELREMGIPILVEPTDAFGEEMGYRIPKEEYYLPNIDFTPEERMALWLLHRLVRKGDFPFSHEVQRALMKLSPDLGRGKPEMGPTPDWLLLSEKIAEGNLSLLMRAVIDQKTVTFSYQSLHDQQPQQREVDPYGIYFAHGCWYTVGYCHLRRSIRSFRVSRIQSKVSLANPRKAGPDFSRPPTFQIKDYSNRDPWEFEGGPEFSATIRFSPKISWWIEENLGSKYYLKGEEGGSCLLTLKARNEESLLSWVLSFGEDAEILQPPDLRKKMIDRLLEMKKGLEGS